MTISTSDMHDNFSTDEHVDFIKVARIDLLVKLLYESISPYFISNC